MLTKMHFACSSSVSLFMLFNLYRMAGNLAGIYFGGLLKFLYLAEFTLAVWAKPVP